MTAMTEQEFFSIWQNQQTVPVELEYRLYYDDQGFPLFYSTENVEGRYVVVDKDTYLCPPKHVRVIDGKLKVIKTIFGKKLAPRDTGQSCHPHDVAIVVGPDQDHVKWDIKHEEPINE